MQIRMPISVAYGKRATCAGRDKRKVPANDDAAGGLCTHDQRFQGRSRMRSASTFHGCL